jgi:hypothetical protein
VVRISNPVHVGSFTHAIAMTRAQLLNEGTVVDPGHWQGVSTENRPDLWTRELLDVQWSCEMPRYKPEECQMEQPIFMLRDEIQPNLPWADDHFEERVSRVPSNPGEQYMNWPWWRGQDDTTRTEPGLRFTHTYQERYWPKRANEGRALWGTMAQGDHRGIRYDYGDLDDLVNLLLREPYTRQAWLPIFFPEDTGAVHGGRVPCTLGYQFMLREHQLHMWYVIRSCDFIRHFRDDLYLSARLLLWVLDELRSPREFGGEPGMWSSVQPGNFYFHCFSLHHHRGDEHLL